ncbi:nicotinate phosphoribosyltransferase [Synchytrium endobioticum]|uniref:Nicotinate phosphoribosyltransferase n=1 Tax=Synchytrium endobioticum TaxID=286115 RepID=A0A507DP52_9FUNG|nr:nicotinate phosphoribosyltransferase [Synchytrium endobioticum]
MITSILDNDLYKFAMQNAVKQLYPDVVVVYKFKNRNLKQAYTQEAVQVLQARLNSLSELALTAGEEAWLREQVPSFPDDYFAYLRSFRFKPKEHLSIELSAEGLLSVDAKGLWIETILYEVPFLSLVSEVYFDVIDKDWLMKSQNDLAKHKISRLIQNKITFSDFGTRRRRNFETQRIFTEALRDAVDLFGSECGVQGTSNVYLAYLYELKPIGTMAHEWIMGASALFSKDDIVHTNQAALRTWRKVYPTHFGIALSDTYGTDVFFKDFDQELTQDYDGVRQDSGDPKKFVDAWVQHCQNVGVDVGTKVVVFSDSLSVDLCSDLQEYCRKRGVVARYGIGTHFTNDFKKASNPSEKSPALNIVMKLDTVNGSRVVKLSDDKNKYTGDMEAVKKVLKALGKSSTIS